MNIAIIFPNIRAAEAVMAQDIAFGSDVTFRATGTQRITHSDGGTVCAYVVRDMQDVDALLGRRADVVFFHDSFLRVENPQRARDLAGVIKMTLLR